MKSMNIILVLTVTSAGIFTGCGVSQSEHQRVVKEAQQVKQKSTDASAELDAANQKIASLNSSLAAQDKTIKGLNDSVKIAEASNTEKEAKIDKLMNLEESAFDDAKAAYMAGDKGKALKAFVRDFPFSPKVAGMGSVIADLKKLVLAQEKEAKQQAALKAKQQEELNRAKAILVEKIRSCDPLNRLSGSDIDGIAAYIANHPGKNVCDVVTDTIINKMANEPLPGSPAVSEPASPHNYSISSERAAKYFSPDARKEMRSFLKEHGSPNPSESDIDAMLKLNERLENH